MFCTHCGEKTESEQICKGCGKLSANIREELLAMSEKSTGLKCEKCGGALDAEHKYCVKCGTRVSR